MPVLPSTEDTTIIAAARISSSHLFRKGERAINIVADVISTAGDMVEKTV